MMQFLIQRAQRDGLGVINVRIGHLAVPQHIIKDYQTADADQLNRASVIIVVVLLIGILASRSQIGAQSTPRCGSD
jgi:hypothetical protein